IKQHCPSFLLGLRVKDSFEFGCDRCPDSVGQFGVPGPEEHSPSDKLLAFEFSPRQDLGSLFREVDSVGHSESEVMLVIGLLPERSDEIADRKSTRLNSSHQ